MSRAETRDDELEELLGDEETDAPLFNSIVNKPNGDDKMRVLTNFFPDEVLELFEIVKPSILASENRGKKAKYSGLDRFIITLSHLKHAQQFNKMGLDFGLDGSVANTMFHRTVDICQTPLRERLMKSFTMTELRTSNIQFGTVKDALLVVDVHFHKSNRPEGRFSDVKHYFSGKHYQYGLKVESAHYPNGLAAFVSRHHPGSTHDFNIFKTNVKSYKRLLTKSVSDQLLEDNGPLSNRFASQWAILGDSAYTGAEKEGVRGLYIKKKKYRQNRDAVMYEQWSRDRVLVENFYGRVMNLWGMMRKTYTYEHKHYDAMVAVVFCLTNYDIMKKPLRAEDGVFFREFVKQFVCEGKERKERREQQRELYNERWRQRKRARQEPNGSDGRGSSSQSHSSEDDE